MNKNKSLLLDKRQTETINDLVKKLSKFNCCAIVRPTGFGKTRTLSRFIGSVLEETRESDYSSLLGRGGVLGKKVLFIYPTSVIANSVKDYIELSDVDDDSNLSSMHNNILIKSEDKSRFEIRSYHYFKKLVCENSSNLDNFFSSYSLIVFDEMHFMGADKVKDALNMLVPVLHKYQIRYIGATATEIRMDKFNVIKEYFDGNLVFSYDREDMLGDKLIEKPVYVFSSYYESDNENYSSYIKKNCSAVVGRELSEKECLKIANHIGERYNLSNILKRNILNLRDTHGVDISYMKFISFYLTIDDIQRNIDILRDAFREAFPEYKIRIHEIYSATKNGSRVVDDVSKLKSLVYSPNTIDLIFSCNMLNYGYHVSDLTGVLMFRHTASPVIYSQQMGRALSVESDKSSIIFDFVYNFNVSPLYKYFLYDYADASMEMGDAVGDVASNVHKLDESKALHSVYLVDELKDMEDLFKSFKVVGEDVLDFACKVYKNEKNGVSVSHLNRILNLGVKDLDKVFYCSIQKDFLRHLVKNNIPLNSYDVKDFGSLYDSLKV